VEDSVDELDLTVTQIRSAIFGLESRVERNRDGCASESSTW
jgi:hypothetical protein